MPPKPPPSHNSSSSSRQSHKVPLLLDKVKIMRRSRTGTTAIQRKTGPSWEPRWTAFTLPAPPTLRRRPSRLQPKLSFLLPPMNSIDRLKLPRPPLSPAQADQTTPPVLHSAASPTPNRPTVRRSIISSPGLARTIGEKLTLPFDLSFSAAHLRSFIKNALPLAAGLNGTSAGSAVNLSPEQMHMAAQQLAHVVQTTGWASLGLSAPPDLSSLRNASATDLDGSGTTIPLGSFTVPLHPHPDFQVTEHYEEADEDDLASEEDYSEDEDVEDVHHQPQQPALQQQAALAPQSQLPTTQSSSAKKKNKKKKKVSPLHG